MRTIENHTTGITTVITNVADQDAEYATPGNALNASPALETIFDACDTLDVFTAASLLGGLHYVASSACISAIARNMPTAPGHVDPKTGEIVEATLDSRYDMDQALSVALSDEQKATMKALLVARNSIVTVLSGFNPELADKMTLDSTLEFMASRPLQGAKAFEAEWIAARRAKLPTFGATRAAYVAERVKEEAERHAALIDASSLAIMALDSIETTVYGEGILPEWFEASITQKALDKLYDARMKKAVRAANPRTKHQTRLEITADLMAIDALITQLGGEVPVEIDEPSETEVDAFLETAGQLDDMPAYVPPRTVRRVAAAEAATQH